MPIQRPTVGWWRDLLLQSPTQCAHAQQQQYLLSQRSGTQLLGSYHDKIHLPMEYTTIFRSHIVYSMGAYKALSIVAINYLCIMQIPSNLTAQPNLTPFLHEWFTATEPVSVCRLQTEALPTPGYESCQIGIIKTKLFKVQSCLWVNIITLQYSSSYKNRKIYINIY